MNRFAIVVALLATACGDSSTTPVSSPGMALLSFAFEAALNPGLSSDVEGEWIDGSVRITVPVGTDLTALRPTMVVEGAAVSPASGVAQDFTFPVRYAMKGETTTLEFEAVVFLEADFSAAITRFSAAGRKATITDGAIALTVPRGTDAKNLAPEIDFKGALLEPASGEARDFSTPVTYTVTGLDGSRRSYIATVTVAKNNAKAITAFSINNVAATISGTAISVRLPFGTDVRALKPVIAITGVSVSPASGAARDFSQPVRYVVTAEDGSTRTYTATVSLLSDLPRTATEEDGIPGPIFYKRFQTWATQFGYTGPIDGVMNRDSWLAAQRGLLPWGYSATLDGIPGPETYRAMQRLSAQYGYAGPIDGILGPNTYRAFAAFLNRTV